jgi:uncharacterized protein GlcG (DUF336 family)
MIEKRAVIWWRAVLTAGLLAVLPWACGRTEAERPTGAGGAVTQPGSAAAQSEGTRQGAAASDCGSLPGAEDLRGWLRQAPSEGEAGGLFSGKMEWAAVVNRNGEICATAVATEDPSSAWPGSQAIAKAKAYTANAYSTDTLALSTARLYTLSQPSHSLWGVAEPNPFNPDCLVAPGRAADTDGRICGGSIAFGGGVPLYRNNTKVGGLGLSGDTACADHEMAKRIRHLAELDPAKGEFVDDITYSSVDGASIYTHPLCPNTWRNGKKLGDEPPAQGY